MSVTICKAKNGVDFITTYNTPKNLAKPVDKQRGFFRIEESTTVINLDGSVWENKRSTLIKGELPTLQKLLVAHKYSTMPGKIIYTEIVESDLDLHPALKRNLDSSFADVPLEEFTPEQLVVLEERLTKNGIIKKTGENGIEMLCNGERILRFTQYDMSGELSDTLVQHTNVAEVTAYRIAKRETPAELPTGN